MKRNRGLAVGGVCLVGLFAWLSTAEAEGDRGRFLEEIPAGCSEDDVTVWGSDHDITLYRGESDGVSVDSADITWFCGKYKKKATCHDNANYIWISRTESRTLYFTCYRR